MRRYTQIDMLKGIGILMVLVNHSYRFVYMHPAIFHFSRSCVQLLVFAAGINAYLSFDKAVSEKGNAVCMHYVCRRSKGILIPYAVFTLFFLLLWKKRLVLGDFISFLISFNIASPVYFVPIFIQMVCATPFLYAIVKKLKNTGQTVLVTALALFVFGIFSSRTYIADIFGSGKYLLGGSYGWVFFLGLIFGKALLRHQMAGQALNTSGIKKRGAMIWALLALWAMSFYPFAKAHAYLNGLIPNWGGNPPGLDSILEGFLIIAAIWVLTGLAEKDNYTWVLRLTQPIKLCGKYSLYIFLWHMFIKAGMNQIIKYFSFSSQSIWYGIPFFIGSTAVVIAAKKLVDMSVESIQREWV